MSIGCFNCIFVDDAEKDIEEAINGNLKKILCDECFEEWDGTRESFLEVVIRGDNPWLPDLTRAEIDDFTGCK